MPEAADRPSRRWLVAVVLLGVTLPGLGHYLLDGAGFGLLADLVWVGGYGGAVLVVWYGWLRPVDLVGPSG